jgi:hypothetical protein
VAAEAEQVERTRRKTWSRARSEVSVPFTVFHPVVVAEHPTTVARTLGLRAAAGGAAPQPCWSGGDPNANALT